MAAGSHIGFDMGNVRPPTKCNCRSQLGPQIGLDQIYSFGDIAIFIFCRFGLKLPIHAHFCGVLGAYFPQIWPPIVLIPKRTILGRKHVVWTIKRENRSTVRPGRRIEKKEVRTLKKSHKVVTFRLFKEKAPTAPIETNICIVGHLADLITYAKFQDDIFRGCDFTGGRISHFSYWFCMGLTTVQRDCAACDTHCAPTGHQIWTL